MDLICFPRPAYHLFLGLDSIFPAHRNKVLEMFQLHLPHILPVEDEEISTQLERSFKKQGIKLYTGTTVEKLQKTAKGVKLNLAKDGKNTELKGDVALVAIGVQGNVDKSGL